VTNRFATLAFAVFLAAASGAACASPPGDPAAAPAAPAQGLVATDADAAALAAIAPPPSDLRPQDIAAPARAPRPAEGRMEGLLRNALALLGTPYRWGGTSPDRGFDCSGLVGYLYRTALGIDLPRISREQANAGQVVADRAAMAAGDLVFFGRRGRVDHVGIYIGEGKFVHAPSRGKDVTVSSLDGGYWAGRFLQARRVAL